MTPENIPYKSFCWCIGTTSFRTKNFNRNIELQLSLLTDFWNLPEYQGKPWEEETEEAYYLFMKQKGFLTGEAGHRAKDAREKTSGLADLGLITGDRRLTSAGSRLLEISRSGDFTSDNALELSRDSFLYFKQMLKMSCKVEGMTVRPFLVLVYLLSKLEYLTKEEFTYILPLCTSREKTDCMAENVARLRRGETDVDQIISDTLMEMENYRRALGAFLDGDGWKGEVTEGVVALIGMNRKSRTYDKVYHPLYLALRKVALGAAGEEAVMGLFEAATAVKGKAGTLWRELLFDTPSANAVKKEPELHFRRDTWRQIGNERELRQLFFRYLHLFKARATLSDYCDLNRRYIKNTDAVLFEDEAVRLDIVPKQFLGGCAESLFEIAFTESPRLCEDCGLEEIAPCLKLEETAVLEGLCSELGLEFSSMDEARREVESRRYLRWDRLIDSQFTDDRLLKLLDLFEKRADKEISRMVTDNADIPTIFEYVLGIIWYKASHRKGDILKYMRLSLEADLLPKTHAGGGEADIVYEYEATDDYPAHTLLLEATLSNENAQRSMEMEPVSRHMGQHLLKTGNKSSYCVFATNRLNINVIADFRSRKNTPFYDTRDYEHFVDGMKIIPLQTSELKKIVEKKIGYEKLYPIFQQAFDSDLPAPKWYENCLSGAL